MTKTLDDLFAARPCVMQDAADVRHMVLVPPTTRVSAHKTFTLRHLM
jgi:hypothetical protein